MSTLVWHFQEHFLIYQAGFCCDGWQWAVAVAGVV